MNSPDLTFPAGGAGFQNVAAWAQILHESGFRFFRRATRTSAWGEIPPASWASLWCAAHTIPALNGLTLAVVAPRSSTPTATTAEVQ